MHVIKTIKKNKEKRKTIDPIDVHTMFSSFLSFLSFSVFAFSFSILVSVPFVVVALLMVRWVELSEGLGTS